MPQRDNRMDGRALHETGNEIDFRRLAAAKNAIRFGDVGRRRCRR